MLNVVEGIKNLYKGWQTKAGQEVWGALNGVPVDQGRREALKEMAVFAGGLGALNFSKEILLPGMIPMETDPDKVFPWIDGYLQRDAINSVLQMRQRGDYFGVFRVGRDVVAWEPALITTDNQLVRPNNFFRLEKAGMVVRDPEWKQLESDGRGSFTHPDTGEFVMGLNLDSGQLVYSPNGGADLIEVDQETRFGPKRNMAIRMNDRVILQNEEAERLQQGAKLRYIDDQWQVVGGEPEVAGAVEGAVEGGVEAPTAAYETKTFVNGEGKEVTVKYFGEGEKGYEQMMNYVAANVVWHSGDADKENMMHELYASYVNQGGELNEYLKRFEGVSGTKWDLYNVVYLPRGYLSNPEAFFLEHNVEMQGGTLMTFRSKSTNAFESVYVAKLPWKQLDELRVEGFTEGLTPPTDDIDVK